MRIKVLLSSAVLATTASLGSLSIPTEAQAFNMSPMNWMNPSRWFGGNRGGGYYDDYYGDYGGPGYGYGGPWGGGPGYGYGGPWGGAGTSNVVHGSKLP